MERSGVDMVYQNDAKPTTTNTASASNEANTSKAETFVVLFTGMDNMDYELECETKERAQYESEKLSELGCQCVTLIPPDKKKE